MEITATCTICEQKFTYERKQTKSKTPYTRKYCDTCRTLEYRKRGLHASKYASKKKTCKTIDSDMKLLKLIHKTERGERYTAQPIKMLQREMNYSDSGMRNKLRDLIELGLVDTTKYGGYCLTLPGILMIKYEGKED